MYSSYNDVFFKLVKRQEACPLFGFASFFLSAEVTCAAPIATLNHEELPHDVPKALQYLPQAHEYERINCFMFTHYSRICCT